MSFGGSFWRFGWGLVNGCWVGGGLIRATMPHSQPDQVARIPCRGLAMSYTKLGQSLVAIVSFPISEEND
jgi:hypothetical protein